MNTKNMKNKSLACQDIKLFDALIPVNKYVKRIVNNPQIINIELPLPVKKIIKMLILPKILLFLQ